MAHANFEDVFDLSLEEKWGGDSLVFGVFVDELFEEFLGDQLDRKLISPIQLIHEVDRTIRLLWWLFLLNKKFIRWVKDHTEFHPLIDDLKIILQAVEEYFQKKLVLIRALFL